MKLKAKNFFYEFLPSARDKKRLMAEQGTFMGPGPKIPGLKNSIKGLPTNYFDFFDKQREINPNTKGINTVPTYDPNIPSPAEGITPPGLPSTPPGLGNTQQAQPTMPHRGGNPGNAVLFGLAAFDALLPNNYPKQQVVEPQEQYNPYKYGTGSQALMQQGGSIPTRQDSLNLYNNSNAVLNYYRNKSIYSENKPTNIKGDSVFAGLDETAANYNPDQKRMYPGKHWLWKNDDVNKVGTLPKSTFRRDIDKNRFLQRENANDILDTRAPMQLYDRRITPSKSYSFSHKEYDRGAFSSQPLLGGDEVNITGYDPQLIKPYDMLTPSEKAQRDTMSAKPVKSSPPTPNVAAKPKVPAYIDRDPYIAPSTQFPSTSAQRGAIPQPGYHPQDVSQQRTNYSATYRDETSPSKDRTAYFPNVEAWRAATQSDQYKPISTQERYDSATAAGYKMYTGGQIMSVERDYPIVIPEGVEDNMPSAKSGNWIQNAVKKSHRGFCTPMTKSTCTPRRKALARTFKKHHGFHEDGGIIPDPMSAFNPHRYAEGGNVNGGANINMVGAQYPNSDLLEQWLLYKQGGEVGPNYPNTDLLEQWIPWRTGDYEQGGTVGPKYPNTDLLEQWIPWMTGDYAAGGQLGPAKAKEMLRDGTAHGKKLTAKQKRFFGFIAGGGKAQQGSTVPPVEMPAQAQATRDPYYEANAKLLHYKTVLNDKLKAKNPQAFGDYFKGLKDVRMKGGKDADYIQGSSYNDYLSPDEVRTNLGDDYQDYLNTLKTVNNYNVQQGQQPLYGQIEGEKDVNNLNYGRRFASLQVNPTINVTNQTTGSTYGRTYQYDPSTKNVNFNETGDLSMRPSYLASPADASIQKLAASPLAPDIKPTPKKSSLTSYQKGGGINSTGYMYGHSTADNDFNIIPSEHITMKGVRKNIMARPIRKGQMGEAIMMSPGEDYTFPGAEGVMEYPAMQQGGEIGTMWGGNAEMESYNPYDGGTVAFNGASHDNGGIGMHYNGQPVEVEGGEYASQDNEGNLNIYGNMYLPGTRTKFKSVASAMADKEKKYDRLKTKGAELVNKSNPANKYEQLSFNSGKVMMQGGEIGQKDIADKKKKLSALQKAMLETAREHGLDAQELSQGKIKKDKSNSKARGGALIPFAQEGGSINDRMKKAIMENASPDQQQRLLNMLNPSGQGDPVTDPTMADRNNNPGNIKWGEFAKKKGAKKGAPAPDGGFYAIFPDQQKGLGAMKDLLTSKGYKNLSIDEAINKWTGNKPYNYNLDDISGKAIKDLSPEELNRTIDTMRRGEGTKYPIRSSTPQKAGPNVPRGAVKAPPFTPYDLPLTPPFTEDQRNNPNKVVPPPLDQLQIPQRPDIPSNVEPLHMDQVLGELYGAATNQVEPVVAQKYQPQLFSPYQVSFQDRINKNQKSFNSLQRLISDPGILSGLAAQKYEADNSIKGEEFRTNQAIANDIINKNVALSNDAQLKNLGIADQQYVRQSTAKSKTKQMNQLILNSISSKYAQNDLSNKRLAAYENLYDYRFVPTKDGGQKATYFGPNAAFNFDPQAAAARQQQDLRTVSRFDQYGNPKGYTQYDESSLEDARKQIDYEMKRRKLPLMDVPKLD